MADADTAVWRDGLAGCGHPASHSSESCRASSSRVKLPSVCVSPAAPQRSASHNHAVPSSGPSASPARQSDTFTCNHDGCGRTFSRAAKLEDHIRTHTGERPFHCQHAGCDKSFRRADHLRRHAQTHAHSAADSPGTATPEVKPFQGNDAAARPFCCTIPIEANILSDTVTCGKRFFSKQHLVRHIREVHDIESEIDDDKKHTTRKRAARAASYKCDIGACDASFHKRKLLRAHISLVHSDKSKSLEGLDEKEAARIVRLPFACEHPGCTKRFATNSKRNAHASQHTTRTRYTCFLPHDEDVVKAHSDRDAFGLHFTTWSDLQEHQRKYHRPKCHYPGCEKTFADSRNLRLHLGRVHHDWQDNDGAGSATADGSIVLGGGEADSPAPTYDCDHMHIDGDGNSTKCDRTFTTKYARDLHVRNFHLGIREHACLHAEWGCERRFTSKRAALRHSHKCAMRKVDSSNDASLIRDGSDADSDDEFRAEGGAVPEAAAGRGRIRKRKHDLDEDLFVDGLTRDSRRVVLRGSESLSALLTGQSYMQTTSTKRRQRGRVLACPWTRICAMRQNEDSDRHDVDTDTEERSTRGDDLEPQASARSASPSHSVDESETSAAYACPYRFSRLYDAQRHLRTIHGYDLSQAEIRLLLDEDERAQLGAPRAGTQAALIPPEDCFKDDGDEGSNAP